MSCSKVSEPQRQRVRFPVCSLVNPLNVTPHSPLYGHQSSHVWTRGVHPGKGPWDGRKIGRTRHDLECQQTRRDEKGLGGGELERSTVHGNPGLPNMSYRDSYLSIKFNGGSSP